MGGEGDILGEDTGGEWSAEEESPEGLTEFEFSPPTAKRRSSTPADLSKKANVEALVDRVIEEVAPDRPRTVPKVSEAVDPIVPNPIVPAPIVPRRVPQPPIAPPAVAPPAVAPPPVAAPPVASIPNAPPPVAPPPVAPRPITPRAITPRSITPSPVTPRSITPSPNTPSPNTPSPNTPSPVTPSPVTPSPVTARPITPRPIAPPPVALRPPPVAPPPPIARSPFATFTHDDAKATAEMDKPELGERPMPKERTPVPVGRDTQTEMFDGEAASLERVVQASFDRGASAIRVPDELSDEVRAASKVLMGRKPATSPIDTNSLTADLELAPPSLGSMPRPPPTEPPPMPTSSPHGLDLDAVADAFDMEASDPAAESVLELAYDPADRVPVRDTRSLLLDQVTPTGMALGTKIMIVGAVIVVGIVVAALLR